MSKHGLASIAESLGGSLHETWATPVAEALHTRASAPAPASAPEPTRTHTRTRKGRQIPTVADVAIAGAQRARKEATPEPSPTVAVEPATDSAAEAVPPETVTTPPPPPPIAPELPPAAPRQSRSLPKRPLIALAILLILLGGGLVRWQQLHSAKSASDLRSAMSKLEAQQRQFARKSAADLLAVRNLAAEQIAAQNAKIAKIKPTSTTTVNQISAAAGNGNVIIEGASLGTTDGNMANLTVSGTTTLGELIATGQLKLTGNANDLLLIQPGQNNGQTVFNISDADGNQRVTIDSNGNTLMASNLTVAGVLSAGAINLASANLGSLVVSGNASIGGNQSVSGGLNVAGVSTLSGVVNALAGVTANGLTSSGQVVITASPSGNAINQGSLYINPASVSDPQSALLGLAVNGAEKFRVDADGNISGRNLTLTGGLTGNQSINGTLSVSGNTSLQSGLSVTGAGNFANTLGIASDFSVNTNKFVVSAASGNTSVAGNLSVAGSLSGASLNTNGVAVIGGDLSVNTNKFTVQALTGNVTSAGSFSLAGDASLAAQLSVGGNSSFGGTLQVNGVTTLGDNLIVNGNTTLGDSNTDTVTVNGRIGSDLVPLGTRLQSLGSASNYYKDLYIGTVHADSISAGSTSLGDTDSSSFIINSDNATNDVEDSTLVFSRGSAGSNAVLRWNSTTKQLEFNQPVAVTSGNLIVSNGSARIGTSSGSGLLTIGTNTTAASGGAYFGTDVNLYRAVSGITPILKTDAGFAAAGTLWGSYGSANQVLIGSVSSRPTVLFGTLADTNLYRSAADTLKTDDAFIVGTLGAGTGTTLLCVDGSNILSTCNTGSGTGAGSGSFILNGTTLQTGANFNIQSNSTSNPTAVINQITNQTADLLTFKNSSGTTVARFDAFGTLGVDKIRSSNGSVDRLDLSQTTNYGVVINSPAAAGVGLAVKGTTSQTGDILQLQNSSGSVLTAFDANGKLIYGGDTNLYRNSSGNLRTDGSLIVGTIASGGSLKIVRPGDGALEAALGISGTSASDAGLDLRIPGSGSTNNFNLYNSGATSLLNITGTGATIFKNFNDSANAFRVQNSSGNTVLNVDTSNNRLGIGLTTPSTVLHVLGDSGITLQESAGTGTRSLVITPPTGGTNTIFNNAGTGTGGYSFKVSGTEYFTIQGSTGYVGIGATPANGLLTVGTNTTTAAGGIYFGTDTALYRSGNNTLKTSGGLYLGGNQLIMARPGDGASVTVLSMTGTTATDAVTNLRIPGSTSTNFLNIVNSGGNNVVTVDGNGSATFKNVSNSASAFQIQNSAGQQLLVANTTGNQVSLANGGDLIISVLTNPTAPTLTTASTGGSLAAATYYYKVSAGSPNGETTAVASSPVSVTTTGTTSVNTLSWSAVTNAASYNVYRSTDNVTWARVNVSAATTSITDNGSFSTWSFTATPPTLSTAAGRVLLQGGSPSSYVGMSDYYNYRPADNGGRSGLVAGGSFYVNIDSDNNSTNALFQIARDHNLLSGGTGLFTVLETGEAGLGVVPTAGSGLLQLATGTTAANGINLGGDSNIYRAAAATIQTDSLFRSTRATGATGAFATRYTGTTADPFTILANGTIEWGDGTNARDTNIYRSTAGVLKTDNPFIASNYLQVLNGSSAAVTLNRTAPAVTGDGLTFGSAQDTNLYRSAADTLKTDDSLIVSNNFTGNGTALFKNSSNSTAAFQVQNAAGTSVLNVDTTNQIVTVRSAADAVSLGSNLLTNGDFSTNDFTGWTSTTGWNAATGAAAHTTGNTGAISQTVTVTGGVTYEVDFTQTGATAGSLTFSIGSQNYIWNWWIGNKSVTIPSSGSGSQTFSITPSSTYDGTIDNITLKPVSNTTIASALRVLDSTGSTALEIRGAAGSLNNTALGAFSLQANTTGYNNNALGYNSLRNNTTGTDNNAIGYYSMNSNTNGQGNVALGSRTLQNNLSGNLNTAIGHAAMQLNTSGSQNTGIGTSALALNTTGTSNVGLGYYGAYSNTTGINNTGLGASALRQNSTGNSNTAVGYSALYNSTGSNNVGIGSFAFNTLSAGNNNTAIGYGTETIYNTQTNSGAFGYNTKVGSSNTIVLGQSTWNGGAATQTVIGNSYASGSNLLSIGSGTYTTGTIAQTGTAITGTSTTFTPGMSGGTIYYADGTSGSFTYVSATSGTSSLSKTVTAGATYAIVWGGVNISQTATLTLQPTTNSSNAFSVYTANTDTTNSTALFNIDTNNAVIKMNTGIATASFNIRTGNNSKVGLLIAQNSSSQTADLLQLTDSSGTVYSTFDTTGNLRLGASTGSGRLTIGTNSDTTAAGGIYFGTDTTLYRTAAGSLRMPGNLSIGSALNVDGQLAAALNTAAQVKIGAYGPSSQAGLVLGSAQDTNLYRSAADTLKTDDSLTVGTNFTSNGTALFKNGTDSATAFQIQNQAGTSNLFVADTLNTRIGIGTNTASGYTLDVNGTVNAGTGLYVGGVLVCTASGCTGGTGGGGGGATNAINNQTTTQSLANFNIQSASTSSITGVLKAITSQTADLMQFQSSAGNALAGMSAAGKLQFADGVGGAYDTYLYRNASNSLKTDGALTAVGNITSNSGIYANVAGTGFFGLISKVTGEAANRFQVTGGGAVQWGDGTNAQDIMMSRSGAGTLQVQAQGSNATSFVVKGTGSQATTDLFQAQDSTGAVLSKIDYQGNLTVKAATINGNITVNGHFITGNSSGTTSAAAGAVAGTGATVSISGNDTAGTITVTAGSGASGGDLAAIAFANAFGSTPRVIIAAGNANAASLQAYRNNVSTTGFSINVRISPVNGQQYIYDYFVAQ